MDSRRIAVPRKCALRSHDEHVVVVAVEAEEETAVEEEAAHNY